MKYYFRFLLGVLLYSSNLSAQSLGLPLGNDAYHYMDRLEVLTGEETPFHSSLKYFSRKDITDFAVHLDSTDVHLSNKDRHDLNYIFRDNNDWIPNKNLFQLEDINSDQNTGPKKIYVDSTKTFYTIESKKNSNGARQYFEESEKPFLSIFYKTPANFFEINQKHFFFKLNPILNIRAGKNTEEEDPIFLNQRGIAIRGGVDNKVYFYSSVLENQARYPDYVNQWIEKYNAIPGQGFYKDYVSSVADFEKGYDYLNAQGYFGVNISKHVGLQFGYGRNFIGNGYRSHLLSDFSNNYLYLKLNTNVWKFHYQNIFAELNTLSNRDVIGDKTLPKKYIAAHHLSFNLTKNINVGFFEATIFSRENHFEFQYLNPVILYRTVEQALGSEDNILIGFDAKWNIGQRIQLYGQFILDEFVFGELFVERRGWWANKYGVQAGLKYFNAFGVDHLDVQVEYNLSRPYTYSHIDSTANYSHYKQPLAHPLGANFKEIVALGRYQFNQKWLLKARLILAQTGDDETDKNWGSNILLPNLDRVQEFDNKIGQGISATTLIAGLDISYQLKHNLFLELNYLYRQKDSDLDIWDNSTNYIGAGIRLNIANRNLDF